MITDIRLQCPTCKRSLPTIKVADSETAIFKRTCPGCKTHWQIKVTLLKRDDAKAIHNLEWLAL